MPEAESELDVLLHSLAGGDPSDAILAQEARGQQKLVADETLPKQINFGTREQFESVGIVFGDDADDLFVYVTLPEGWRKERTDHSMWSKLLDNKGRERAMIFYKAAFYDRKAHIDIKRRFSYGNEPVTGYDDPDYYKADSHCVVRDCGEEAWHSESTIGPLPGTGASKKECETYFNSRDSLEEQGRAWLNEHYPDWQDPCAYWD